jgi:uncharacterized protein (DUF1778 family)
MLEGLAPKTKDALCVLMRRAADLSAEDYQILMDALDDPRWSSNGLAEALRERGFVIHKNAVGEHRKGVCPCAR